MAAPHLLTPVRGRAAQAAMLADGRRLHLQDGPIDLIIEASGDARAVRHAYAAAAQRFAGLLDALCAELPALRTPARSDTPALYHPVAQRMADAVAPFAGEIFITPMAAVAGAVADEILKALICPGITRAYVNNGGDIALHLSQGARFTVGLVDRPDQPRLVGRAEIDANSPVRGVATSGWRGRSFSLGIADAVTILAPTAAMADAAATVIANAVDLPGHRDIVREAACDLQPDSDLGTLQVTQQVLRLGATDRSEALGAGLTVARALLSRGLICAAALHLQGDSASVGSATFVSLQPQHEQPDA